MRNIMDRTWSIAHITTLFYLMTLSSASVQNITYCTGVKHTDNKPLCPAGEVIQVEDVFVYDFHESGRSEDDRSCHYDSRDTGERLLDVDSVEFAWMVYFCDGRKQCLDINLYTVRLSDGSWSDYILMQYECTRNHTGGFKRFTSRFSLQCPPDLEIRVLAAYYTFICRSGSIYRHVGTSYIAAIRNKCDDNSQCHDVRYKTGRKNCQSRIITSDEMAVYFKCESPAPATTSLPDAPQITTELAATLSASTSDDATQTQTAATQHTSPSESRVTDASRRDQSSETLQSIGLYAGVSVAGVVVIVVIVLTVVCVKRTRDSKKSASSPIHVNPVHNGHPTDQIVTDNVYTMGEDDYSQVGPVVDQVSLTPKVATDNVYTMGDEEYIQVGPVVDQTGPRLEHNTTSEARVQVGTRSVHYTTNSGHIGTNAIHGEGATLEDDYSLATAVDEYEVVNRQRKNPDELEIVDNVNYEQCPIKFTSESGTAARVDHDDIDQTIMVENTDYVPWGDKSTAGDTS